MAAAPAPLATRTRRRRWLLGLGLVLVLAVVAPLAYRWPGRGALSYFGIDLHPRHLPLEGGPSNYPLAQPRDDLPGLTNFAQISPALYRGSQPTREGFEHLRRLGIKTVVDLREFHDDRELIAGLGLRYVKLGFNPVKPRDDLIARFLQVVLDPANQPVYVHCQAGADRTGTMVVMYRVVGQNWPLTEAVKELPRFGFHEVWTDLTRYLAALDVKALRQVIANTPPPEVLVIP